MLDCTWRSDQPTSRGWLAQRDFSAVTNASVYQLPVSNAGAITAVTKHQQYFAFDWFRHSEFDGEGIHIQAHRQRGDLLSLFLYDTATLVHDPVWSRDSAVGTATKIVAVNISGK
jgi:hypothetical protein